MRRREFVALIGSAASLCTRRSFAQSTEPLNAIPPRGIMSVMLISLGT